MVCSLVDAALRRYLDAFAPTMPRTAWRHGIERLPAAEREHYLGVRAAAGSGP